MSGGVAFRGLLRARGPTICGPVAEEGTTVDGEPEFLVVFGGASSVEKISRTMFRSLSSSSEPVDAAKEEKSCTRMKRAAASFMAVSSNGNG